MLKRDKYVKITVLLIATMMVISGCSLLPVEESPLVPPLIEPVRENVNTFEVVREDIAMQVKGNAYFVTYDDVYHNYTGPAARVKAVHVRQGNVVQEGDLLIEMEIEDLDIRTLKAELDLETAKSNYLQALQSGNERDITVRKLELDMATLTYNKTKENLESRTIRAKSDGVITFLERIEPNAVINDHRTLVVVADVEKVQLYHEVSNPVSIKDVQLGMQAEIRYKGETYEATVVQTPSSAPETSDHSLSQRYSRSIYLQMDEIPKGVVLNEAAEMIITLQSRENAVVIPTLGLRSYQNRNYVQILDGTSRREVDVVPGIRSTNNRVEIVDGLEPGQLVILQ